MAPDRHRRGLGRTGAGALAWCVLASAGAAEESKTDESPNSVLFTSAEMGASTFVNSGFKWRPGDALNTTGFVVMGAAGGGTLRNREMRDGELTRLDYLSTQGSLLIGYQWMVERGVWAVFAGAEADFRQPLVNGAIVEQAEPAFGARLQAEVWLHLTDRTLLTGTLIAGTAPAHLWARTSWGYRIWRDVHMGPEATLSLERDYREGRLGLHATGLRIGRFNLRLSGGLLLRASGEPAGYAALTTDYKL